MYPIQYYNKYLSDYEEAMKKRYFAASNFHQVNNNSSPFYVENILKQSDETEHESSLDSMQSSCYDHQEFEEKPLVGANDFSNNTSPSPKNDADTDGQETTLDHEKREPSGAKDYSLVNYHKRNSPNSESHHSGSPSPGKKIIWRLIRSPH